MSNYDLHLGQSKFFEQDNKKFDIMHVCGGGMTIILREFPSNCKIEFQNFSLAKHLERFVDQRLSLAHFDTEQIVSKHT